MKKKMGIKAELELLMMKQGDTFVAYFPALDISTCGDTFEEAAKRAEDLPEIFFEETMKHGTLHEALEDLGWKGMGRNAGICGRMGAYVVESGKNSIDKLD